MKAVVLDEPTAVACWRVEMFLDLGFSLTDATSLALTRVDWRDAERLLEQGCTPELARRILE